MLSLHFLLLQNFIISFSNSVILSIIMGSVPTGPYSYDIDHMAQVHNLDTF